MTFEEINSIPDLYMYLTLSDLVLFTKDDKAAEVMVNEIRKKSFNELNIDFDAIQNLEMKRLVEVRAAEFFPKYFNEAIRNNQDKIDFDKYLLLAGYRNYRMIKLLSDEKNRDKIQNFDDLKQGMRRYAKSTQDIYELIKDKNIKITYKPKYINGILQGYWDDESQKMVDINISQEDLKKICESKELKDALEYEDKDVKAGAVQINVDSKEGVYPKAILEDYLKRPTFKDDNSFGINARRITEVMNFAMKQNGIHQVDKNKLIAASPMGLYEIPYKKLVLIKQGINSEFKSFYDKMNKNGFSLEDEIELYGKLEVLRNPGFDDKESNVLYKKMIGLLKEKILLDPVYVRQHDELVFNYILSTKEAITEKSASDTALDNENPESIKKQYDYLQDFRKNIIMELYSLGVIDKGILENSGFINELTDENILDDYYKKSGYISADDAFRFISFKNKKMNDKRSDSEIVCDLYKERENDKKCKASTIKRYLEIIPNDDSIKLFLQGKLSENDLGKKGLKKADFEKISDKEILLKYILNSNEKSKFYFNQDEILKLYGLKFNAQDIIALSNNGIIDQEKILEVYNKKSVNVLYPENAMKLEDVTNFYNYETLNKLVNDGKINKKFVEVLNSTVIDCLSEEEKREYFGKIKEDILAKENNGAIKIVEFYKLGIMPDEFLKSTLTNEDVISLYEEEKLDDFDIITLYAKNILSYDTVSSIVTDDELYDAFDNDMVDYNVLRNLPSEYILIALEDGKIDYESIFKMYSTDMSKEIMVEILNEEKNKDLEFGKYIADGTSEEKIEVLLNKYYISHDELTDLVQKGLISEEKAEEYVKNLSSHEEYEKLFSTKNRRAHLTRITEPGEERIVVERGMNFNNTTSRNRTFKIDPDLQEKFMKTLGADERTIYLEGNDNSLDGYTIYGFEDSQIMVFVNHEKPSQATYITSFLQGKFFLNKISRKNARIENGEEIEEIESDATKAELRDTPHVKVRNSSKMWARNVYDSMCKLDPNLKKKYKKEKEYRSKIDKISEEIQDDYILRKD